MVYCGNDSYEISVIGVYDIDEAKELIKVLSEYIELHKSCFHKDKGE